MWSESHDIRLALTQADRNMLCIFKIIIDFFGLEGLFVYTKNLGLCYPGLISR